MDVDANRISSKEFSYRGNDNPRFRRGNFQSMDTGGAIKSMINRLTRLYFLCITFKDYYKMLNRNVAVQEVLYDVVSGKRGALSTDECKELAIKLGVPEFSNKKTIKK